MKQKIAFGLVLFSLILTLAFLSMKGQAALDGIETCQTLSIENETYNLNASIEDSLSQTCFLFGANNITLDCNGFTINMTNTTSNLVFNMFNVENAIIKNCIIYAQSCNDNTLVETNGITNFTYQNNSAYIIGKSWAGVSTDNTINVIDNYFNQSCYHEIANEPSFRMTGQYINYDNNIFDGYCNNNSYSGTNTFENLNHSIITNSIFNIMGSADEPLTFHAIHGNLIDNITINATNLWYVKSGMVGRFCCGTDNIFSNSRMYLNKTFNIYAVLSDGNNITWNNIYIKAIGTALTMSIYDYDNVIIKNSIFEKITIKAYGNNLANYTTNSRLNNLLMDNITSNRYIWFYNAIDNDSWNLTNSYLGNNESYGISLINISYMLIKSNYINYSNNYNITTMYNLKLDSNSNNNIIYDNTFDTGNITDNGTGNIYCVDGIGNIFLNGAIYFGSGEIDCPSCLDCIGNCYGNYTIINCTNSSQETCTDCLLNDSCDYECFIGYCGAECETDNDCISPDTCVNCNCVNIECQASLLGMFLGSIAFILLIITFLFILYKEAEKKNRNIAMMFYEAMFAFILAMIVGMMIAQMLCYQTPLQELIYWLWLPL